MTCFTRKLDKFKLIFLVEILRCRNSKIPFYFIVVGFISPLKNMPDEINTVCKFKIKDNLERTNKESMRMKVNLSDLLRLKRFGCNKRSTCLITTSCWWWQRNEIFNSSYVFCFVVNIVCLRYQSAVCLRWCEIWNIASHSKWRTVGLLFINTGLVVP